MTNLGIRSESGAGSDDRWMGSREGLETAQTVTLDADGFAGVEAGLVKAGTQLAEGDGGKVVRFTDATQTFVGFLADDRSVAAGDSVGPMLDRGRIRTSLLPNPFVAPSTSGRFVFVS